MGHAMNREFLSDQHCSNHDAVI